MELLAFLAPWFSGTLSGKAAEATEGTAQCLPSGPSSWLWNGYATPCTAHCPAGSAMPSQLRRVEARALLLQGHRAQTRPRPQQLWGKIAQDSKEHRVAPDPCLKQVSCGPGSRRWPEAIRLKEKGHSQGAQLGLPQNRIKQQEMQSACQSPRTICRFLEAPKPTLLCGDLLMPVSDHLKIRRVQVEKEEAHNTQSAEIREVETSTAAATGGQGEEPALTLGLLGSGVWP